VRKPLGKLRIPANVTAHSG